MFTAVMSHTIKLFFFLYIYIYISINATSISVSYPGLLIRGNNVITINIRGTSILWKSGKIQLLYITKMNFYYLPQRGGIWKLKKAGGSRGGQALFLFNFFKVYHFCIQKLFYSLQNCVMYLKKNYFFLKTPHTKLSKNEPENIP